MTNTLALLLSISIVAIAWVIVIIFKLLSSKKFAKKTFENNLKSKTSYELYLEKRRVKLEEHSKGIHIYDEEVDQIIDRLSEVFVDGKPKYRKSISPALLKRYGSESIISSYREALGEGFKVELIVVEPNPFKVIEITIDEEVDISKMETTTENGNWSEY